MADDRIDDLEIKLAFQDKLISDLDALVRGFGTRVDAMQRQIDELKRSIDSPPLPLGPVSEKPPHY